MGGLLEVDLVQQALDFLAALAMVGTPLEPGKTIEQVPRTHARIRAQLLRQITQATAQMIGIGQHIHPVQVNAAGIGLLQGRQGPHQAAFARAVRPQQAVHPGADTQVHAAQRFDAVVVALAQAAHL
ncbi:hypothetical protein D3C84_801490 [compost metagenome]